VTATVDATTLTVRGGEQRYRFVVDCASGNASLEADGVTVGIRLLRWGEKCALARFAAAGVDFLARQLLHICSDPAPPDAATRDAALALVQWVHAPDEPPLPMDARLLARVTLDLCDVLGCGIEDLALRPAPEVEALWHARDQRQPVPAEMAPANDVTRIVVLPDETDSLPPAVAAVPEGATASSYTAPSTVPEATVPEAAPSPRPSEVSTETVAAIERAVEPVSADVQTFMPDVVRAKDRPRFRVHLAPLPPATAEHVATGFQQQATARSAPQVNENPTSIGATVPLVRTAIAPTGITPTGITPHPAVEIGTRRIQRGGVSAHEQASPRDPASAALARVIAAVSARAGSPQPESGSSEDSLDDLAGRLEAAAGALGIALVD
jgi:hypothetical protein